ncbi:hypothetical protein S40285_08656 [Stachybotrys chlorohalonatus IBT 40285]|uniref:FAD-binding domain-containing protein n=1 Tax=Stachybotrys chlorohalonatus (strain IBT 40285) TaxID=1283841 RepID=A0A084R0Z0_STAC4|nr:hypothetical protein S40285_08656 [Stachybotrys chlorohalonata IBT 40285]
MSKLYDVIIAGGGPVGLQLACELALARASVLVLEANVSRESPWKVHPLGRRALNVPSIETFYRRGLLDKILDSPQPPSSARQIPGFKFGGIFAGIMLNAQKFDMTRHRCCLPGPALRPPTPTTTEHVENVLTERAESLGVVIRRGLAFNRIIAENKNSISVMASDEQEFRGRWLVGCDGARSAVRGAAGITMTGTDPKFTGYAVHCDLDHPEMLKPGFNRTDTGMYAALPESLYLVDFDDGAFDRTQELTHEHLQAVFHRTSGRADVNITKVHLASTFTDRAKQATTYRKGRVLLAGDAAHFHGPLGGQGLNAGLGDAMNLGWKLASTVRWERDQSPKASKEDFEALINSYEKERHPIASAVLQSTRAQVTAMQPGTHGAAIYSLLQQFINTQDGANLCIDSLWGLSQQYRLYSDQSPSHPTVGCSAPDFHFKDGSRLGSRLENGQGIFIDFENDTEFKKAIAISDFSSRVEYVGMAAEDRRGFRALLVRPDGIIAWAAESEEQPDAQAASAALKQWLS